MRITELPLIEEIKTGYRQYREKGFSRQEATEALMRDYQNEVTTGYRDDGSVFWIALADAQYSCKELSSEVAQKGISALDQLEAMGWRIASSDISRRRKRYQQPAMPERKTMRPVKKYRCPWNIGDVFAYRLEGAEWDREGLSGTYMLLQKVGVSTEGWDGYAFPIVTARHWNGQDLPTTRDEVQRAHLLKLARGRLGFPNDQYDYRMQIVYKSSQKAKKVQLEFIGNFPDIPMPKDEINVKNDGAILMILPDDFSHELYLYWKIDSAYSAEVRA